MMTHRRHRTYQRRCVTAIAIWRVACCGCVLLCAHLAAHALLVDANNASTSALQTQSYTANTSLAWGEWQQVNLQGNAAEVGMNGASALNLNLTSALTPSLQLSGKVTQHLPAADGSGTPAAIDGDHQLDWRLGGQLLPHLQIASRLQFQQTAGQGHSQLSDNQLDWEFAPRWKLTTHYTAAEQAGLLNTEGSNYGLVGDLGTKQAPQQFSLLSRHDTLPDANTQDRQELAYNVPLPLGGSPLNLQLHAGEYRLQASGAELSRNLFTVQMPAAHPLPGTTLSLGYYNGPALGLPYLSYRNWGYKPPANTDSWTTQDLQGYRELGGELTQQVAPRTTLVYKQYNGAQQGLPAQSSSEYGLEQHLGTVALLGGCRTVLLPATATQTTPTPLTEVWWQLNLPRQHPLPAWAAGMQHDTVFTDSAQWGIGQTPAWVSAPNAGWTISGGEIGQCGVPLQSFALQTAQLLNAHLVFEAEYAQNPVQGATCLIDQSSYQFIYLGYLLRPNMLLFARELGEEHPTQLSSLQTYSLGLLAQLSAHSSLQLQVDGLNGGASGACHAGVGYTFEYQRAFSDSESLVIKYRVCPNAFNTLSYHVGVELGMQRTF